MKLLRIPEVCERVRRSKSTIYSEVKKGRFPAPLKQGGGNYWLEAEIDAYLEQLMASRPVTPLENAAATCLPKSRSLLEEPLLS